MPSGTPVRTLMRSQSAAGRLHVSFVIPVRNDAMRLRRCLESIAANDYPVDCVEVVVVDNGSTDSSPAVAAEAGARVLSIPDGPVSLLRNRGAIVAKGDILAFVDADHAIARDWIRCAVALLAERPAAAAVGALCRAPQDGTWVQRAYDRLRGRSESAHLVEWLGAGNLAVRRSAFLACGGFDTTLETCEDVDLCKKLRRRGGLIVSDPALVNVHFGDPSTIAALFRSELWRGRSNLAVSLRPPLRPRELPSVAIPVFQLVGVVGSIASLAINGRVSVALALAGLFPLAVFPLARAWRMSLRQGNSSLLEYAGNTAVAFVYDAARALALVAFAGHHARRT